MYAYPDVVQEVGEDASGLELTSGEDDALAFPFAFVLLEMVLEPREPRAADDRCPNCCCACELLLTRLDPDEGLPAEVERDDVVLLPLLADPLVRSRLAEDEEEIGLAEGVITGRSSEAVALEVMELSAELTNALECECDCDCDDLDVRLRS